MNKMLDAYKELTPVVYGENGIRYLRIEKEAGEICFFMHWHERMELLRVASGELWLQVGGKQVRVEAGQAAVVSPCVMHCGTAGEDGIVYHTIMFDVEKFQNSTAASLKYLLPVVEHKTYFNAHICEKEVIEAVDRLLLYLTAQEGGALQAVGMIYEILGLLYQHCVDESGLQPRVDENFKEVLEYIDSHYAERISARDISAHFGYNETYFCRRFKAVTGIPAMKYLQALRLEQAQRLLKETQDEVGVVAWKCGFADAAYFSNCFKKSAGYSPTQFRAMWEDVSM